MANKFHENLIVSSAPHIVTESDTTRLMGSVLLALAPAWIAGIYIFGLITEWVKDMGGLEVLEGINNKKAETLYAAIDGSDGYYRNPVCPCSRSKMNVVFRLPSEELEAKFLDEAKAAGMIGLKGHRSVGGIRASIYNAMPLEGVEKLVSFMQDFKKNN